MVKLGMTLWPPALPETFGRDQAQRLISSILTVLDSDEFRCPATRADENIGNENVVLPGGNDDWNIIGVPEGPYRGTYDDHGRCTQTITFDIEHEYGDFGSVLGSYPIATGECAEYHGYAADDGSDCRISDLFARWSERRRIRKLVHEMISAAAIEAERIK